MCLAKAVYNYGLPNTMLVVSYLNNVQCRSFFALNYWTDIVFENVTDGTNHKAYNRELKMMTAKSAL